MNTPVTQLHMYDVVGTGNTRLTTVIAPDDETAETEARKALTQPGRELSYQSWLNGGRQVVRR